MTILKTGDPDLDLYVQIGLQTKYLFHTFRLSHFKFCLTLELFMDHLKVSDEFETRGLDLDLDL